MSTEPLDDERTRETQFRNERASEMYIDALRMREWCIDVNQENGRLRWELETVRAAFNSAVVDVNYHADRAAELESELEWRRELLNSTSWKIGRLATFLPRLVARVVHRIAS